jgi:hypothetical protein
MKICIVKLGNMVEAAIELVTLGRGKDMATWIAHKLGFKSCGCDERKLWLNKIVGCDPSQIKLDLDEKYIDDSGNGGSNGFAGKKSGHPLSKY